MHAAVLHALGEVPCFERFPDPVAEEGEALVRVTAAALTPVARSIVDGKIMAGRPLPFVPGLEGVGVLANGRRVSFAIRRAPFGSMAQLAVAPVDKIFEVPDEVDDVTAAGMFHPGLASWLALSARARLRPGESVLVLGAAGAAGRAAVAIAKLLGAGRVVAAGRDQEVLAATGADAVVDLRLPDEELSAAFADAGPCTVIIDFVWGRPASVLLRAMPRTLFVQSEIRFVQLGNEAGTEVTIDARLFRRAGVSLLTSTVNPPDEVIRDGYRKLMLHAAAGDLRIPFDVAALPDVSDVWQRRPSANRLVLTN